MTTISTTTDLVPAGWGEYASSMPDALSMATMGWLAACRSPNTREAYQRDLLGLSMKWEPAPAKAPAWIPWCQQNNVDPLTARRSHVEAWGLALGAAGFSAKSRARKLSVVSSWYNYLMSEELTERNPAGTASRPNAHGDYSPATALSEGELDRLLDAAEAEGPRALALVHLLYFGGFRVGSLLSATIGDLAWDQGKRALVLDLKGGKTAREPLDEIVASAVDAYLATRPGAAETELLFTSNDGGAVTETSARRLVQRLARHAGIESWQQLSPHSLRATHITHARDEGVAVDIIQDTVHHADARTTLGYDRLRGSRPRSGTVLAERRRRYEATRSTP